MRECEEAAKHNLRFSQQTCISPSTDSVMACELSQTSVCVSGRQTLAQYFTKKHTRGEMFLCFKKAKRGAFIPRGLMKQAKELQETNMLIWR